MVLSENPELKTEGVLAGQAVFARVVADTRVDYHAVADLKLVIGDAAQVADRIYHSGRVAAENPWWRDVYARHPTDHEKIQMV
jgi:hypothetical protein